MVIELQLALARAKAELNAFLTINAPSLSTRPGTGVPSDVSAEKTRLEEQINQILLIQDELPETIQTPSIIETDEQNNTLRNALIIGGALLLIL